MYKCIIFNSNKVKVYFIWPLMYYRKDMKVYGEWDQNKTHTNLDPEPTIHYVLSCVPNAKYVLFIWQTLLSKATFRAYILSVCVFPGNQTLHALPVKLK